MGNGVSVKSVRWQAVASCVAFRGTTAHQVYVAFRDKTPEKRPTFKAPSSGAGIAIHWPGRFSGEYGRPLSNPLVGAGASTGRPPRLFCLIVKIQLSRGCGKPIICAPVCGRKVPEFTFRRLGGTHPRAPKTSQTGAEFVGKASTFSKNALNLRIFSAKWESERHGISSPGFLLFTGIMSSG
jgi:hypothetical protein